MAQTTANHELRVYYLSYLRMFQIILKKKPGDERVKQALYQDISRYLNSKVKTPDDYIRHIPQLAKMIGVKTQALSSYIGSNFMEIHSAVSKELAEQKSQEEAALAEAVGMGWCIALGHWWIHLLISRKWMAAR